MHLSISCPSGFVLHHLPTNTYLNDGRFISVPKIYKTKSGLKSLISQLVEMASGRDVSVTTNSVLFGFQMIITGIVYEIPTLLDKEDLYLVDLSNATSDNVTDILCESVYRHKTKLLKEYPNAKIRYKPSLHKLMVAKYPNEVFIEEV